MSMTRLGRRDRAALETLYATGCRASEVAGLRPADLDLVTGLARCIGKGNKERRVPLGSRAIAALTIISGATGHRSWPASPRRAACSSRSRAAPLPDRPLVDRQANVRAAGLPVDCQPAHPPA